MRKSHVFKDSCSQLFPCSTTCLSPAFQPYLRSCTPEWQAHSLLVHAQCCTRMWLFKINAWSRKAQFQIS